MMASLPSESNTCQQIKLVAHTVDCVEVIGGSSKSSRDGVDNMEAATSAKANCELSVTASLDIAGGKIDGQVPWSKLNKKHMQIGDTRWEQC